MKYTLKNRPRQPDYWRRSQYEKEWEEWFEGLEKELKQRFKDALAEPSDEMNKLDNLMKMIKEILGE